MENTSDTAALFIVINAGFSAEVMDIARNSGAKGATIMNARGEGLMRKSVLGITVDSEKELLLMLIERDVAENIMRAVKESFGMHTPAHGICFTMPVGSSTVINNFPQPAKDE